MIDPQILSFHLMLLNDSHRMRAYRQAVFNAVRPGDIVLDVGTGSGILAIFACQAGAKHVYAGDRGDIIILAREIARVNNFGDRITFLQKDVRQVKLDEPVDVITSELIAKAVLGQNMAELIGFCRDNFLKSGGRILPEKVELRIAPVENENNYRDARPPSQKSYDIIFDPLERLSINKPISSRIPAESLLAVEQTAYSYSALTAENSDTFDSTLYFKPERRGTLHGFTGWFTTVLSEGIELTNKPPGTRSWDTLFFPLAESVKVEPGMSIEVRFRGRSDSEIQDFWIWNTTVTNGEQVVAKHTQSSFSGRILTADTLRKASDAWAPTIRMEGKIAQRTLSLMQQNMSLLEIANQVRQEFPQQFESIKDSISMVRKIAEQYGD